MPYVGVGTLGKRLQGEGVRTELDLAGIDPATICRKRKEGNGGIVLMTTHRASEIANTWKTAVKTRP